MECIPVELQCLKYIQYWDRFLYFLSLFAWSLCQWTGTVLCRYGEILNSKCPEGGNRCDAIIPWGATRSSVGITGE